MTAETITCPFCNALVPRPAAPCPVVCPRCGEAHQWRGSEAGSDAIPLTILEETTGAADNTSLSSFYTSSATPGWVIQLAILCAILAGLGLALKVALPESKAAQSAFPFMVMLSGIGLVASLWLWFLRKPRTNNVLAVFVLGNMAAVALIVLPFTLANTPFRREHDPKGPQLEPAPPRSAAESVAPALLAGLGFLPVDCNLAAGIHVSELLQLPGGPKLLAREQHGKDEAAPWLMELALGRVEKLTGLKLEDLDHVVVGARIDAGLPAFTVVVRTLRPYDPAKLAKTQAPVVAVKHLDHDLYQIDRPPGMLFCANPRTLLLFLRFDAVAERDKQLLTTTPRSAAEGPPRALRPILEKRLTPGMPMWWAAADIERPEVVMALLPLGQKDPELATEILRVKSVAVGLRLLDDAAVHGACECPDAAAARNLAALLAKQKQGSLGTPKVEGPEPNSSDSWVSFQLRGSPEAVAASLRPAGFMVPFFGKK